MEDNENKHNNLFNRMVKAGRRTYFVTVREAKNSQKYLTITESKLVDKNKFDRTNIMVFQDKLSEFATAFADACKAVA